MAIPEFAYTQTVAKQLMSNATGPSAWVMFINVKSDITVYKQIASNQQVELIPAADYTVTITPASPWEFTWAYSGATPPLPADHIIIFRRVGAIFNDFQPGAFLNADSLNRAFNIETLANNDVGYYQQFSRPGYDDQTLVEQGVFDPPASPGESDHNPKIAESNYELPYLASSPGVAAGDVYVWGYVVDPGPVGSPRTGKFVDTLLHQSGGGTVGQLTQELAAQCLVPGSNIIGVCQTNIAAAGWDPGPGMTLSEYFGNLYHHDAGNPLLNGATLVGYGGWAGYTSVSGALQRLNEPATSAADSGATHVKWWTGTASNSVQTALFNLNNPVKFTLIMAAADISPVQIGVLPPDLLANPSLIERIVWSAKPQTGIYEYTWYTTEVSDINLGTNNTTGLYPCYYLAAVAGLYWEFVITLSGIITVAKNTATTMDWDVKCVIYRKPGL